MQNTPNYYELPAEALIALKAGRKIEAIKLLRNEHRIDLKTAKEQVDTYLSAHPELRRASTVDAGGLLLKAAMFVIAVYLVYRFVF